MATTHKQKARGKVEVEKQKLADTVVLLMRTRVVCFEAGEFEFDLKKENKKEKDSGWTVI